VDFIIYLLEQCELVDRSRRCQAMRAILYLVQGNSNEINYQTKVNPRIKLNLT
jgi:hypothetical protein